eukprot:TRINITY_DN28510_c0_g1_i1.p1 TRINITY_DN28510_c0_g1~~TRINITY_DN28510_c0_g1_i1.p1  ORF type:complete len:293 (+),score=70.91 TRINITY_DN28510_c0_g1_i1:58-879(+)
MAFVGVDDLSDVAAVEERPARQENRKCQAFQSFLHIAETSAMIPPPPEPPPVREGEETICGRDLESDRKNIGSDEEGLHEGCMLHVDLPGVGNEEIEILGWMAKKSADAEAKERAMAAHAAADRIEDWAVDMPSPWVDIARWCLKDTIYAKDAKLTLERLQAAIRLVAQDPAKFFDENKEELPDFELDEVFIEWAETLLEFSAELRHVRFKLVPARMKEVQFFSRYFRAVHAAVMRCSAGIPETHDYEATRKKLLDEQEYWSKKAAAAEQASK